MRWFDLGEEARGVVAIGQHATGVVAIGQFAYGAVAVGQFAFGLVAVGQFAVGLAAIGLVAGGLYHAVAMAGVGARGRGFVLELLPALGRRTAPDRTVTVGAGASGWARLRLEPRPDGRIAVFEGERRVREVRLDPRVRRAAAAVAPGEVWALLRPSHGGPVADRLVAVVANPWREPRWWLASGARLAGLTLLAAGVWGLVVRPLVTAWLGPGGILVP